MSPVKNHLRLTLLSAFAGVALLGVLALFLRRRKRRKAGAYHEIYVETDIASNVESCQPNSLDSCDGVKRRSTKFPEVNGGNRSDYYYFVLIIIVLRQFLEQLGCNKDLIQERFTNVTWTSCETSGSLDSFEKKLQCSLLYHFHGT